MNQEKKNIIWNAIGVSFNSFNSLFFLILVKRINDLNTAGVFSYGYAIACLLYGVSIFYNRVYQVVNDKYSDKVFIKSRIITCIIMFLLSIIVSLLSIPDIYKIIVIILLCLFRNTEALSDIFYGIMHKNNNLEYAGKSMMIKAIVGLMLFGITNYIFKNLIIGIISLVIVNMIGTFIDYKNAKKYYDNQEIKGKVFDLLKDSITLFLFLFLGTFIVSIQKYVIEFYCTEDIVAIFNILIMPATIMTLCGLYLINPMINKIKQDFNNKDYKKFNKSILIMNLILIGLGIIGSLLMYFIGIWFLNIIYNINLNDYKLISVLILIGAIFYAIYTVIYNGLIIMNKNKEQLIILIFSSIFSIVISILLIQKYLINGAIFAYFISMLFNCILYYSYYLIELKKLEKSR